MIDLILALTCGRDCDIAVGDFFEQQPGIEVQIVDNHGWEWYGPYNCDLEMTADQALQWGSEKAEKGETDCLIPLTAIVKGSDGNWTWGLTEGKGTFLRSPDGIIYRWVGSSGFEDQLERDISSWLRIESKDRDWSVVIEL